MNRIMLAAMAATVALTGAAVAAEPFSVVPMGAFVQDIDGKQVVGYYLASGAACEVTLMVSEPAAEEAAATTAARVRFSLAARSMATVESANGGMLALTCGEEARTLTVDNGRAPQQLASR